MRTLSINLSKGKGDTIDRVVGLEFGADIYVAKPFQLREIVARIRTALRRYDSVPDAHTNGVQSALASNECYSFGDWSLSVSQR